MPNDFKLQGDYYVSKAGNDANTGTSPDTPKRTISSAFAASNNSSIIVGSGVYNEALSKAIGHVNLFYADGSCVIRPTLNTPLTISISIGVNSAARFHWFGFTFYNCTFNIQINPNTTTDAFNPYFENCKFVSCNINLLASSAGVIRFKNCQFVNSSLNRGSSASMLISTEYCVLINSNLSVSSPGGTAGFFRNNYMSPSSTLSVVASNSTATYNNIQGSLISTFASSVTSSIIQDVYSRYYNLSLTGSGGFGTLADPYRRNDTANSAFSFSNFIVAYPAYSTGSFSLDPKFNAVENWDFTLASDSPMIGRASDGISNIGGSNYAVRNPANSTAFSGSSATVEPSLVFNYSNYILSGSELTGSVTSAPILINNLGPKVIQKVTYNGLLAFNKDTGSLFSGSNMNVPDFDTYTSASLNAGANPDRLVYYMRFTSGSNVPVTEAGWDNAGLWTAGEYNVFEWNTKPSVDSLGRGNGTASFNPVDIPTYLNAQWVQMQIKLRNDYLL